MPSIETLAVSTKRKNDLFGRVRWGRWCARLAFLSCVHHLDRHADNPPGDCFPEPGIDLILSNHREVEKMSQGFLETPYFFNATYLLMEIKGLVMYLKG